MAKLYFRYGAMGSGKSVDLLKVAYNYQERGQNTLILTSMIDDRYGVGKISSRIGLSKEAIPISNKDNIFSLFEREQQEYIINCVLVDEAQFLKKTHIWELSDIVDIYNIPVICYGLKTDYKSELFEGSKELLAIADSIEEIKCVCWCGKKGIFNTRVVDGKIITDGPQIVIGGNESYLSLCRKHYKEGKLG